MTIPQSTIGAGKKAKSVAIKPVKAWAVVGPDGIATPWISDLQRQAKFLAAVLTEATVRKPRRVIPVLITPLRRKKGKRK